MGCDYCQMSVTRSAATDDAAQLSRAQKSYVYRICNNRYAEKNIIRWWSDWLTWQYTARCRETKDKRIHTALHHSMNEVSLPGSSRPYLDTLAATIRVVTKWLLIMVRLFVILSDAHPCIYGSGLRCKL